MHAEGHLWLTTVAPEVTLTDEKANQESHIKVGWSPVHARDWLLRWARSAATIPATTSGKTVPGTKPRVVSP
jgi:hypothetical protein